MYIYVGKVEGRFFHAFNVKERIHFINSHFCFSSTITFPFLLPTG